MTKYTKHTRYIERELIKCPICHGGGLVQDPPRMISCDSFTSGHRVDYCPICKGTGRIAKGDIPAHFFEQYCENMDFWQTEEANHETN